MKKFFTSIFALVFLSVALCAQHFLVGTDEGLFDVEKVPRQLFAKIKIYSIQKNGESFYFLTDKGIMKSADLKSWSFLTENLPKKTLKVERSGKFELQKKTPQLKDLAFHPDDENIFVTATNNSVFLTIDGGKSWRNLGNYGYTNGIKAVAVTNLPDVNGTAQLTVFVSTAVYGMAWKQPFVNNRWYDANEGLAKGPESPDEISDILTCRDETGQLQIYVSQTFKGKLYKYNWKYKLATRILNNDTNIAQAKYLDSLNYTSTCLVGVKENEIFVSPVLFPKVYSSKHTELLSSEITSSLNNIKLRAAGIFDSINCAFISQEFSHLDNDLSLRELFALRVQQPLPSYAEQARQKRALYIPPHKVADLDSYFALMKRNNLNAIVIDMKDDMGLIRYDAQDINVTKYGAVRPKVQLEEFVQKAKAHNIYLIARMVVFKDRQLYYYANGKCAVKDYTTGGNWRGYDIAKDGSKDYYYEYWVDPYNEEVWQYNVAIANELVARGFDEIQFDYIRFPTDGDNLRNSYYPAQGAGMDKESAIMSFLSYARAHIKAPLSIDIYGANGWYRTGARTGQEVEMLIDFVDVICPMYYPSHFAQSFLAYEPKKERPYRIYYQGAYRAKFIARNKAVIRPWAQCFYIPVSYDRQFYGAYYIKSQITALADSIDEGFAFWNTVGNYGDLPDLGN